MDATDKLTNSFRAIADSMKDGLSILDTLGAHVYVNNDFCEMTGFAREELLKSTAPYPYWPEEEYDNIQKAFGETLDKEFDEFELIFKSKCGKRFPVIVSPSCTLNEEGEVVFYHATVKDITQHKKVELNLAAEKHQAQSYLDVAGVLLAVLDTEAKVKLINMKGAEILGYNEDECIGKNWFELCIPEKHKEEVKSVFSQIMNGDVEPVEYYDNAVITKSGETKLVSFHNSVFKGYNGAIMGVMLSGQDITEKKLAEEALEKTANNLLLSFHGIVDVISKTLEARDPYTSGHMGKVAELSCAIAEELGLDTGRVEGIRLGALIHDIGKIQIPAEILSKPSKLSPTEFSLVQAHSSTGYEILKDIDFPWPVADIAHQHHERMNGSGYPQGLKGEEICLEARIVAVADVVEAISSHRPYRPSLGLDAALNEIRDGRETLFDRAVVDACLTLFLEGKFSGT